jgi:hypothetical protein
LQKIGQKAGNPVPYVHPAISTTTGRILWEPVKECLVNFDMTLLKRTPITKYLQSEFRIEAFNFFNRTNCAPPIAANRVIYIDADDVTGTPVLSPFFGQLMQLPPIRVSSSSV